MYSPPQRSSAANPDSAHNSASGRQISTISGHKLLIVIERKLLSFIAYRHQASNEFVVALDRLSYRAVVRRLKANGLHQFPAHILHALSLFKIDRFALWHVD